MIKSLKIINYQGHTNSKFDFNPGVNIIAGKTNHGKSSVVAALEWARTNRPVGTKFINRNDKKAEVVTFLDNATVKRSKGDGDNSYQLNDTLYQVVGNDVPEHIKTAFNMNDINVQNQFDKFFMLQETSGTVAKELNKTVGLEVIDSTLQNGVSMIRECTREIKTIEGDILRNTKELKELGRVNEDYAEISELAAVKKVIECERTRMYKLKDIITKKWLIDNQIGKMKVILALEDDVEMLWREYSNIKIVEEKKEKLDKIIKKYDTIQKDRERIEKILVLEDEVRELKSVNEDIEKRSSLIKSIVFIVMSFKKAIELQSKIEEGLKILEEERIEAVKLLDYCTECGANKKYWKK